MQYEAIANSWNGESAALKGEAGSIIKKENMTNSTYSRFA
jgi:hypothetical protein